MKSPESMIKSINKNVDENLGKVRSYLAVLIIYDRHDLALRFLDLLSVSAVLDKSIIDQIQKIIIRRRKKIDKRHKFLTRANSFASLFSSPFAQSHLIN